MRWRTGRRSSNVEDRRRGGRVVRRSVGGGLGAIVIALVALYFGIDPSTILGPGISTQTSPRPYSAPGSGGAADDQLADFVSVVLADTEDTWQALFSQMGRSYVEPTLVLFSAAVESACGYAQAASGPFYCPGDQKVYIDLAFYRELRERFRAPGDFAQAYVIAHEVGHHVQTVLGISDEVRRRQAQSSRTQANQFQVRMELQADCLAGIWANHAHRTRQILEAGDIEEALNAASRIGDDTIQRQTQGHVVPDSFTHGTSAQRMRWFQRGLQSGDPDRCDTFSAQAL
jgi:predicted metalloprotease